MKNRLRLLAFLSVLLLVTMACSISRQTANPNPQPEEGDQNMIVSETRTLGDFTGIEMDGGAAVTLVQGSEHSVKVEGSQRVVDQVVTEVNNGVLEIHYRDKKLFDFWNEKLTLTIAFADLTSFRLDGGVELKADDLELEKLDFTINGGASLKMNNLSINTLNMELAGGGDIHISGVAENLNIDVSGGTNFESEDLKCAIVNVKIAGAANVAVWATEKLDLDLAGAYNVSYWGTPAITQSIGGIGQIKALGNK